MLYTAQQTSDFTHHHFEFLLVTEAGHVLTITLNRPEKKNAMNAVLMKELAFALSYAHHQPAIWVVVLAAQGTIFCAGADLKAFAGEQTVSNSTIPEPAEPIRLGDAFAGLQKPCIAQVHAAVYAGGFLLLGGCTHVIASDNATFSLPEVKRGLFPFQVMASLLPLMPARTVLDLCIRARTLSAAEALQTGLISEVVTTDQLEERVRQLTEEILQMSPVAIRMGLQAYQEMQRLSHEQQHTYLHGMLQQVLQTEDAAEGIAAFAEKRPPIWKGK
ncbi:MAG: enoyl-CoA hydratase-related protein [Bacteroidota bacterium]